MLKQAESEHSVWCMCVPVYKNACTSHTLEDKTEHKRNHQVTEKKEVEKQATCSNVLKC